MSIMRLRLVLTGAAAVFLLCGIAASARVTTPQFKTIEAKHFERAEGVELSPDFSDYLYAELRAELLKAKIFGQVIGEGEVVDAGDTANSIVIEGNITEYKKGNVAKDVLIGFTAGWRSLRLETAIKRRSDQKVLLATQVHVRTSPRLSEKALAKQAAKQIVNNIKKSLNGVGTGSCSREQAKRKDGTPC